MKKKAVSMLIAVLMFTLLVTHGYAMTPTQEIGDGIVEPPAEACPYWPDGRHRYQSGISYEQHYKQYQHLHYIYDDLGGIIGYYYDLYCKVYDIEELYCACGKKSYISYYSYSHCHP